jgi:hypothetical protein
MAAPARRTSRTYETMRNLVALKFVKKPTEGLRVTIIEIASKSKNRYAKSICLTPARRRRKMDATERPIKG